MSTKVKQNGELAVAEDKDEREGTTPLSIIDISNGDLPDLSDATEFPLDLMSDYWTPENKGESKRVFYDSVKTRLVLDQQTGEAIELPCVFFFEKIGKDIKTISNGSKRLVGIFEHGQIKRGAALLITYLGKKKNATNGFQSDTWSVKPLIVNIQ